MAGLSLLPIYRPTCLDGIRRQVRAARPLDVITPVADPLEFGGITQGCKCLVLQVKSNIKESRLTILGLDIKEKIFPGCDTKDFH